VHLLSHLICLIHKHPFNNQRPASFFGALFALMYRLCLAMTPKHKFKFKNRLFSLDATVVQPLPVSVSPGSLSPHQGRQLPSLLDYNVMPASEMVISYSGLSDD
ncbi:MAG: hypothetical protein M1438_03820, partial [Deltaproteobacteria bacterium]|nr:hypothetical protein [Deltaproteobacteria bacterium]